MKLLWKFLLLKMMILIWDFRKFKSYGPCAKNYDKKKGENQIFEEMFS